MLQVLPLDPRIHDRAAFRCGEPTLDAYLQRQATQHQRDGISTPHVLIDIAAPTAILGYYSLSAAQVLLDDLQESDRQRLPRYPIPAVRMGRLAVDARQRGRGYGERLIGDAVARCLRLRADLGVRVLLVDALNDRIVEFYEAYGFRRTRSGALSLYLPLGKG